MRPGGRGVQSLPKWGDNSFHFLLEDYYSKVYHGVKIDVLLLIGKIDYADLRPIKQLLFLPLPDSDTRASFIYGHARMLCYFVVSPWHRLRVRMKGYERVPKCCICISCFYYSFRTSPMPFTNRNWSSGMLVTSVFALFRKVARLNKMCCCLRWACKKRPRTPLIFKIWS